MLNSKILRYHWASLDARQRISGTQCCKWKIAGLSALQVAGTVAAPGSSWCATCVKLRTPPPDLLPATPREEEEDFAAASDTSGTEVSTSDWEPDTGSSSSVSMP